VARGRFPPTRFVVGKCVSCPRAPPEANPEVGRWTPNVWAASTTAARAYGRIIFDFVAREA